MAIQSCLAYDCTSSRSTFDAAKGIIEHCTAVRCKTYAGSTSHVFSTPTTLADSYIRNCIAANCYAKGYLFNGSTNQEIRNCIAYTNDYDADRTFSPTDESELNCLTSDPKFKKFADSDFRIRCSSPASGSGVTGEHAASASHGLLEAATGALNYIHKISAFDTAAPDIGAFAACAAGYAHTIIGVEGDNISKFIGVVGDDISKAIGVE